MNVLLSFVFVAHSFTLLGDDPKITGHSTSRITIDINSSDCPSDLRSLLQEAMTIWNTIPSSRLKFELGRETTVDASATNDFLFNERAIVACSTDFETVTGSTSASVTRARDVDGDKFLDRAIAVINMDNTDLDYFDGFDTETRKRHLIHVLGHIAGLGHTGDQNAVMHINHRNVSGVKLHQDDIDGMTYLYPEADLTQDPLGCSMASPPPPQSRPPYELILIIPLIWFCRRLLIYKKKVFIV